MRKFLMALAAVILLPLTAEARRGPSSLYFEEATGQLLLGVPGRGHGHSYSFHLPSSYSLCVITARTLIRP